MFIKNKIFIVLSIVSLFFVVLAASALTVPVKTNAAGSTYDVPPITPVIDDMTVSLTGHASATFNQPAANQTIKVADWGDLSLETDIPQSQWSNPPAASDSSYDTDWSTPPVSHTYTTPGTYTITVKACHSACGGGEGFSRTVSVTVPFIIVPPADTTPPDTTIDSNSLSISSGGSSTNTAISFTFSGTDDTAVASYECSLDSASYSACTSPIAYTSLGVAAHTFDVRAIDTSLNVDPSPAHFDWIVTTAGSGGCTSNCGGSGGGGGGGTSVCDDPIATNYTAVGACTYPVVANAIDAVVPIVVPDKAQCAISLNKFLRRGYKNDSVQVKKLQQFLTGYLHISLPATGKFGPLTEKAVKQFQLKHRIEILDPWKIKVPTGIAYITTLTTINNINCPDLKLKIPEKLINFSKNPEVLKR